MPLDAAAMTASARTCPHGAHLVGPLAKAHQKVVGLDVPVDEALRMHKLNPRDLHKAKWVLWDVHTTLSRSDDDGVGFELIFWPNCSVLMPCPANSKLTSWSASIKTVLRLNFRLQKLNRSSRLGPSRSSTITL
jgi:hypothetical protein